MSGMKTAIKESLDGWRPRRRMSGWFYIVIGFLILILSKMGESIWSRPIETIPGWLFVLAVSVLALVSLDYLYSVFITLEIRKNQKEDK